MRGVAWWMVLTLVISPAPHEGLAVKYAPGVMTQVARNRGIEPQPCMVAYTYAEADDMGKLWLDVEGVTTGVKRRCLVVDMPRVRDRPNLIRRGALVEIDAASSRAICGAAWRGKASECPVRVRVVSDDNEKRGRNGHEFHAVSVAQLDGCGFLFQHRLYHC